MADLEGSPNAPDLGPLEGFGAALDLIDEYLGANDATMNPIRAGYRALEALLARLEPALAMLETLQAEHATLVEVAAERERLLCRPFTAASSFEEEARWFGEVSEHLARTASPHDYRCSGECGPCGGTGGVEAMRCLTCGGDGKCKGVFSDHAGGDQS